MRFILIVCILFGLILNEINASYLKSVKYLEELFPSDRADFSLGQVGGLATDENDDLVVFHRADRTWKYNSFFPDNRFNTAIYGPIQQDVLYLIDSRSSKKIASWGAGRFYMPHGLTLDHDRNIWLTDVGSHQVYKFNFEQDPAEPILTLGESMVNGNDDTHFCKPTSVAVSESSGDIFVADGYCNRRVVRFDKEGKFLREYQDEKRPIQIAHSIALIEEGNLICTVSREEGRIICFDIDSGAKSAEITNEAMNTVYAIRYDVNNKVIQAATGENRGAEAVGLTFSARKETFGKLLNIWNGSRRDLSDTHDLALNQDGSEIYFGQLNGEIDVFQYA